MHSILAWLDYAEKDRRAALELMDRFGDRETRDELGLGTIRDALADRFFPGTSTIQTRARYFLFIPWINTKLEAKRVPSARFEDHVWDEEMALINALMASDDQSGVIGKDAREDLKRLAGNIYWQGLEVWRIRLESGPQSKYYRTRDAWYARLKRQPKPLDKPEEIPSHSSWHPHMPPAPTGFPKGVSFRMEKDEADFLIRRILAAAPDSLLAFLVERSRPFKLVDFPWEHPMYAEFPDPIKELLEHARIFSETLYGISLLYNVMLAEESGSAEFLETYSAALLEWAGMLDSRKAALKAWDLDKFWALALVGNPRIHPKTRGFVQDCVRIIRGLSSFKHLSRDKTARDLVRKREVALKADAARLGNPRRLELWKGESGAGRIEYRWRVAQNIILDIIAGRDHA
jgi:hypothetical protein